MFHLSLYSFEKMLLFVMAILCFMSQEKHLNEKTVFDWANNGSNIYNHKNETTSSLQKPGNYLTTTHTSVCEC